jgi:hypothetical protein
MDYHRAIHQRTDARGKLSDELCASVATHSVTIS